MCLKNDAIISKGIQRLLISEFLGNTETNLINFKINEFGKPSVENGDIYFSVSHCLTNFVIAIRYVSSIGIDIEKKHLQIEAKLANFILSNEKFTSYKLANSLLQNEIILKYWTRKVAYLKGFGTGLVNNLHQIDTARSFVIDSSKLTNYRNYCIKIDNHDICSLVLETIS